MKGMGVRGCVDLEGTMSMLAASERECWTTVWYQGM